MPRRPISGLLVVMIALAGGFARVQDAVAADSAVESLRPITLGDIAAPNVRILDLGTGLSVADAPSGMAVSLANVGFGVDDVGYSSAAVSTLASLYPGNKLSVEEYAVGYKNAYGPAPRRNLDDALGYALGKLRSDPSAYHAILLNIDPSWYPDTLTDWAAMYDPKTWARNDAQALRFPHTDATGTRNGFELWGGKASQDPQLRQATSSMWDLTQFGPNPVHTPDLWESISKLLAQIRDLGVPVIVAAGDVAQGSTPRTAGSTFLNVLQSLMGPAGLDSVITVGAAAPDASGAWSIPGTSAAGPARDGLAKPDLVAPADLTVAVPANSLIGQRCTQPSARSYVVVDWRCSGTSPRWMIAGVPNPQTMASVTANGASAGSTHVAAAVAALEAAQLRARWQGSQPSASDAVGVIRSVLQAVASQTPAPGAPVFLQGSGVLARAPQPSDVTSFPLLTSPPRVPQAAATASWNAGDGAPVSFWSQSSTASSVVAWTSAFVGGQLDGLHYVHSVENSDQVRATNSAGGYVLSAGSSVAQAGMWCGTLRATSPTRTASYPFCSLRTLDLTVHVYYPGKEPVAGQERPVYGNTVALYPYMPENPVVDDVFRAIGTSLPVPALYSGTTNPDGNVPFSNVAPGLYTVKVFGNFSVPGGAGPGPDHRNEHIDIGANLAYQQSTMIIGSPLPCGAGDPHVDLTKFAPACTPTFEQWVAAGGSYVEWDRTCLLPLPTGRIQPSRIGAPGPMLPGSVAFACGTPKMRMAAAVSSHQIRNLSYGDFENRRVGVRVDQTTASTSVALQDFCLSQTVPDATNLLDSGWTWTAQTQAPTFDGKQGTGRIEGDLISGSYSAGATVTSLLPVGTLRRSFAIPSPNYSANLRFNLDYDLENAVVGITAVIGGEVKSAFVSATGAWVKGTQYGNDGYPFWENGTGSDQDSDPNRSVGRSSIDWFFQPDHATQGTLCIVAIPLAPGARATIGNLTMQMDTWGIGGYYRNGPMAPTPDQEVTYYTDITTNLSSPMALPGSPEARSGCRLSRKFPYTNAASTEDVCNALRMYVHTPRGLDTNLDYTFDRIDYAGTTSRPAPYTVSRSGITPRSCLTDVIGSASHTSLPICVGGTSVNDAYFDVVPIDGATLNAAIAAGTAVRLRYVKPQVPTPTPPPPPTYADFPFLLSSDLANTDFGGSVHVETNPGWPRVQIRSRGFFWAIDLRSP